MTGESGDSTEVRSEGEIKGDTKEINLTWPL